MKPILKFCVLNPLINNDILHTIPIDKYNLLFCDRNRKLKSIDGLVEMNWVALRCIALFLEILLPNNIAYTYPSNLEMKIIFCKFSKTFCKIFCNNYATIFGTKQCHVVLHLFNSIWKQCIGRLVKSNIFIVVILRNFMSVVKVFGKIYKCSIRVCVVK